VAGGNPELHVKIPDLRGFPKDEVVIPRASRTQYDHSVRMIGVKVFEVSTLEEFQAALGPKTAMIYMKTDPRPPSDPLQLEVVTKIAKSKGVPVLADAAAEILTIPNVHLQKGVDVVGYSGGKVIRGPQCAGLMLGRKDLLQAAWMHGAPHHGYGRAMKVGKEEALGMLAAVEAWVKRDHEAEWQQYLERLDRIARRVSTIPSVTTSVRNQPERLGNRSPRLTVNWDATRLNISGEEVAQLLWDGNPRIALSGGRGGRGGADEPSDPNQTSVSITAFMMVPGEEKIVADRLYEVLSATHPPKPATTTKAPVTDMTGRWDVTIQFSASSSSNHVFHVEQQGGRLEGSHQGDVFTRDFSGSIDGDSVEIQSNYNEGHGDSIPYRFTGNISGDTITGSLDMGEYLSATWTARRHDYGRRSG
jgi:L-seryl-tRNA(Ser) seleniumtransferase